MKSALRKAIRCSINKMTEAERLSQSLCVCRKLVANSAWRQAHDILLYAALPDEVDLSSLFTDDKCIWLPVVDGDTLRIRQYVSGKTSISTGFHIEEPTVEAPELQESEYSRIQLAIIPGRAFTLSGHRMGRGKGYYDRLLTKLKCTTLGVCFDCQIVEELPMDPWDKKLDGVLYPSSMTQTNTTSLSTKH